MNTPRPYQLFDMTLLRTTPLSPSLRRFTFGGSDVANMRTCAPDQRVKLYFPDASGKAPTLSQDSWLEDYQAMAPADRPPRRTYTIRALRAERGEVDIDIVLHGSTGPASRWALAAVPGDRLQIVAPDRRFEGDPKGYEWRPPPRLEQLLLLADETALPAIAGILEELARAPHPPATEAYLEVPVTGDCITLPTWPSLRVHWTVRGDTPHAAGQSLIEAARNAVLPRDALSLSKDAALPDIDTDRTILWETQAPPDEERFYTWVAGEAGAVNAIRRILLKERGLPRTTTNLMGYWRYGQVPG